MKIYETDQELLALIRNFWHYERKFKMQQRKICGLAGNIARIRKFFGDIATQTGWMRQYWLITKIRSGAYRTESRK
jgi:hypothetical protein